MGKTIKEGKTLTLHYQVELTDLASFIGTGKVDVLATPAMITFMEQTCVTLIEDLLPEGCDTVSVEMNVKHIGAVPIGKTIKCNAHLKYVDGKKLFFDVAVVDENHKKIGIGAHERYIIQHDEFTSK
jgi:predicted thioesterase